MENKILKHKNSWCWGKSTIIVLNDGLGIVTVSFENEYPEEATITGLSVHESARNIGYGNILLQEAEKEAKEHNIKKISIYADQNTFAYDWYLRHGYEKDFCVFYPENPEIKQLSKQI